jgi:hypothetical protein
MNAGTLNIYTGELVLEITEKMHAQLGPLSIQASDIDIDPKKIKTVLRQAWWAPAKNRLYLLNRVGDLVQFTAKDAVKFMRRNFDTPVQNETALLARVTAAEQNKQTTAAGADRMRKAIRLTAWGVLLTHMMDRNQRDAMRMRVDMFAQKSTVRLDADYANVEFQFIPPETDAKPDPEVIADYKAHFPALDAFLEMVVASRFVVDRKQSYLWLHCDSDWGKNLLMDQLKKLGLVVTLSVKEAEAAFEGKPLGLSVLDFKRAIVIVFDEFKYVKAELKQLQNTLTLSPKFQLRTEVEIYAKVFMSKEAVPSLAGDYGVEDQFANRFSYIRGVGAITSRPFFNSVTKARYARGIEEYVCSYISQRIGEYVAIGQEAAEIEAENQLEAFASTHGIDQYFERFSASLQEVADSFGAWLIEEFNRQHSAGMFLGHPSNGSVMIKDHVLEGHDGLYLAKPQAIFDQWVTEHIGARSKASVSIANGTVFEHLSADGYGCKRHRPYGGRDSRQLRCIRLKDAYGSAIYLPGVNTCTR